jgi:hypothetical protein
MYGVPRSYYLRMHDLAKKIYPDSKISAFITDKHPCRADMVVTSQSCHGGSSDLRGAVKVFATQLQELAPDLTITPTNNRVTCFFRSGQFLTMTIGVPGVSVQTINETPTFAERTFLRACIGYDEDFFLNATDKIDRATAIAVTDWASRSVRARTEILPPPLYWLSHIFHVRKGLVDPPHDPTFVIQGTIAEFAPRMFGQYPLEAPFCEGEDLNTTTIAKQFCLYIMDNVTQAKALTRDPSLVAFLAEPRSRVLSKAPWDNVSFVHEK